ncbi:uncharacterized protein VDAG_00731 [Verticillium dahliae VdLs.17]|uniref:Uncharacterized protein n=1 Tax=Verticillium dahliae (strain VdLs.17 / ATCC MYA-4575 / FGSC 10137) TaxID=498257 RepID=G2WQT9_VERDV|nr:uncharacterized protein VDAG_00731 [Verticillium dahliae VdLs.17]EGY14049.1 hypothetical protein VDAG_00731 [Verticillium dahliae VdLs.17]
MVLITPGNTICAVWEPFNFRFEVSSMYITLVTKVIDIARKAYLSRHARPFDWYIRIVSSKL